MIRTVYIKKTIITSKSGICCSKKCQHYQVHSDLCLLFGKLKYSDLFGTCLRIGKCKKAEKKNETA